MEAGDGKALDPDGYRPGIAQRWCSVIGDADGDAVCARGLLGGGNPAEQAGSGVDGGASGRVRSEAKSQELGRRVRIGGGGGKGQEAAGAGGLVPECCQ